jgi:transcription elongation factor Elf1
MNIYVKCPHCGANNGVTIWVRDDIPKIDSTIKSVVTCKNAGKKVGCGNDFVSNITLRADIQTFKIEGLG